MKKVIRHKTTRAFFTAGDWTKDFEEAEKFFDMPSLLKAQEKYNLSDVEIVLLMKEQPSQYDVVLSFAEP